MEPRVAIDARKGMAQFNAPELFPAGESEPSIESLSYALDLAHYVLASGNNLPEGETVDGPKGTLRVSSLKGTSGKSGVMLTPVRPN